MKNSYLKYALGLTNLFLSLLTAAQTVSVANYWEDRQAAISLTFDDGVQEHYTLVAPHLDRYALKGTFGINGKYIGDIDEHYAPRLTWEECRIMVRNGHEICSHSWSHPNLTEIDSLALQTEIRKNDSVIQAETGIAPTSFLYPFNAWTPQVKSACEKNKIGSRLCQFALGQRNSGCTATSINAWLREQIDQRLWGVTMTHGIYTAWDQWDEPWILWEFFRDLAFKKDSVWIDTFSNIQAYLKERNAITLTTAWEKTDFVITLTLTLDRNLFQMPLTLKIDGYGLDSTDRSLLKMIIEKYDGGPVGIETLAAALGEDVRTLEDVCEPFLLQAGLLQRTPRGRKVTPAAFRHLGYKNAIEQQNLF